MARKSSIDGLPEDVRKWLEHALMEDNFTGYQLIVDLLRESGHTISKSGLHRFGQKLERRMGAIKASTEAAKLIIDGSPDDQDARSEAVIAMVQTELFETILNLQEATDADVDPAERLKLLSAAAKNIATMTRASVVLKKHKLEVRERVEAAAAAVDKIAIKGGLSAATVEEIRRQILGVAS